MTRKSSIQESHRVKKFKDELVAVVPRFPNDRGSLDFVRTKSLGENLIDYFNWRSRYVGIRSRTVVVGQEALNDPRWRLLKGIDEFIRKVEIGEDLTPYLSLEPHTRGYTPASRGPEATLEDRWSDKDFLLNALGYHHFHLGDSLESGGHIKRTDELIFAEVERDVFKVLAVFDHSVFEHASKERERLWDMHQRGIAKSVAPGSVVIMSDIMTSGHSGRVVRYAQHCNRCIRQIDPRLENADAMKSWFALGNIKPPKTPQFEWCLHHLDLGVVEKVTKTLFSIQQGWN